MTTLARPEVPAHRRRRLALALLVPPIGLQLLLGIGEMAGGDLTGVSHLVLATPLVVLGLVALRWPVVAGVILVGVGTLILGTFVVLMTRNDSPDLGMAVLVGLLAMPVVAGALLLSDGRTAARPPTIG